eukprot:TRINITY_DN647_c0_g1_i3.p1 TRINITY_DN647_c0_g1~~TRINITY_DN647_c0_g1_i3.p1  ORF type:complete len:201 (+),score=47.58 TRINITY_DN647_c0_g1_i3:45-605(+)
MKWALVLLVLASVAHAYDKSAAVSYAAKWWNSANHDCSSTYSACTPWSYWGGEECGYSSQGGDCANFVSQCLLAGGHAALTKSPCRGYPCGKEEVGASNLGNCLKQNYGWQSTCGKKQAPPSTIVPGDVVIFRGSSCSDTEAHATIVTKVDGSNVYVTCHSTEHHDYLYTNYGSEFSYYQWLHYAS